MSLSAAPLSIEHALLGFLQARPMHGYEIYQQVQNPAALGEVWRLKQSRLYALLGKLERRGYVRKTVVQQESLPPRKVFHLTAAGEQAFQLWLQQPVEAGRQLRLEFMAKLYFARRHGAATVLRLIEAQRQTCRQARQAELTAADAADTQEQAYLRLVHQFRAGQLAAMLTWLDDCAAELNAAPHPTPASSSI